MGCSPIPISRCCSVGEMDLEGDTLLRSYCLTVRVFGAFMSPSLVPWLGGLR